MYSEGIGLCHEDKRTYIGEIVEANADGRRRLYVAGSLTFGSDMGSDARPEPIGNFQLFESVDTDIRSTLEVEIDDEHRRSYTFE